METGRELIARIADLLVAKDVADYEARVIAEEVTGDTYSDLIVNKYELTERQRDAATRIIDERNTGKPLAYVLRSTTFRDLDLYVDERVLIPRSETETVVQYAIDLLNSTPGEKSVVDMCTGSGAIALSIAHEVVDAHVYASDISSDAIDVARLNGVAVGSPARRVNYFCGDLFAPLPDSMKENIELIISNPPYIGEIEKSDLDASVLDHEPHLALFAGEFGTDVYKRIIEQSQEWLRENGVLVLEISQSTKDFVRQCAQDCGFTNIEFFNDLTGRDRVAVLSL